MWGWWTKAPPARCSLVGRSSRRNCSRRQLGVLFSPRGLASANTRSRRAHPVGSTACRNRIGAQTRASTDASTSTTRARAARRTAAVEPPIAESHGVARAASLGCGSLSDRVHLAPVHSALGGSADHRAQRRAMASVAPAQAGWAGRPPRSSLPRGRGYSKRQQGEDSPRIGPPVARSLSSPASSTPLASLMVISQGLVVLSQEIASRSSPIRVRLAHWPLC